MESIDILKDPILGAVTSTIAVFVPVFVIDGATGATFGFYPILILSTVVGVSIAFIIRRIR